MDYLKRYIYYITETCKRQCNGESPTLIKMWRYKSWDDDGLISISLCIDEQDIINEFMVLHYNDYFNFIYHNRFDIADGLNVAFPEHYFIPCFVDDVDLDCDPELIMAFVDLKNIRYIIENDINDHGFIDIFRDTWRNHDLFMDILVRPTFSKRIMYRILSDDLVTRSYIDECSRFIIMIIQYLTAMGINRGIDRDPHFKNICKYFEMQLDDTYKLEMEISNNPFTSRFNFDPF